jgi:pre-mRNA-processing factor 6
MIGNKRERENPTQSEQELDRKDYSESNFNKWNGYEENLFQTQEYDEEDKDADVQYNMVDLYMDERRKKKKEQKEIETLMKMRNEKPTIRQSFSDIRSELRKLSKDDWEKIPDIQDFTIKKRKIERYAPNTDSNLERALNDSQMMNSIEPSKLGMETPLNNSDIVNDLGKAKNSVLSVVFDKMSDKVSGMNSVNPVGYLTEMNNVFKVNSSGDVQDFKKARIILKSILNTDPKNIGGWIAAARLEELDGKLAQARSIITQAAENILNSEDIWLEAARLHNPEDGKLILAKGISHLPTSKKLWLSAADIEKDKIKKCKVLRKALENLPLEEEIWKRAIELENEEEAKLLLYRAVECIPHNVDMWLALAKLENFSKAKLILNKARKALPMDHSIWVHAAKLEEAQNGESCKAEELIERGIKTLAKNGKIVSKETWLEEARNCEMSGSIKTCSGIIKASIKEDFQNEYDGEKRQSWVDFAEESKQKGCIETFRIIYHTLLARDDDLQLWMSLLQFEKKYGGKSSQDSTLKKAVDVCPDNEILWLMYAKHKWETESIEAAKKLLEEASITHPNNEHIILAKVKLLREENNFIEAESTLLNARKEINTEKIWMQYIQLLREQNRLEEAEEICKEALSKFKTYPKMWMILAQLKIQKGEENLNFETSKAYKEEALKILEKGLVENKKNVVLYILNCRLLIELNREAVARRVFEIGMITLPNNDYLLGEFIKFEWKSKNYSNANSLLAKGLKDMPTSGILWSLAIDLEKPHLKHSKAADALSHVDNSELVMTSIAKVYLNEKNLDKTRKWLENAIRINADYADAWLYYYKAEIQFGDENIANDILKRCEEAKPKHGDIWQTISKKPGNWRLKTKDILMLASDSLKLE